MVSESEALRNWQIGDIEVTVTDKRDHDGFVFRVMDDGAGPFCEIQPFENTLRLDFEELGIFQQLLKALETLHGKSLGR